MDEEKKWKGTTYGNGWMHRWLIRLLRYIDVRVLYVFVAVFVVPVCLILNRSGKIIYRYFRRQFGYSAWKALRKTYANHYQFSQVVIDKFAMYAGKKFKIDVEGYSHFQSLAEQEPAFIQLSSHIGNYEIAGYSLVAENKPFNALVFFGEKESVMQNRAKMFSTTNIHMIPIKSDMSHLYEIDQILGRGEILSMPSDRIIGSKKYIELDFLGGKAKFPLGPFRVATMRGLDVIAVNVMKTAAKSYKIYVTPLRYDKSATRQAQVEELSGLYVKELERIIRMYPTQWYNFYDFWTEVDE